jgi:hypothetical protein
MDAADLHARFKADLAEARRKDCEDSGRLFLTVNVPLGRFWLTPLTLERYLFLEQVQSPFLGFCEEENVIPTKGDVLHFLWIMNPKFRPVHSAGRRFALCHYFINWKKYAGLIYELIAAQMEKELEAEESNSSDPMKSGWIAQLIDGAASQYGWSEREILDIPIPRARAYMDAMAKRLMGEKDAITFEYHADKVRHEYIKSLTALNKQKEEANG